MKGSYRVIVQNSSVRYDFVIRRNITIIKGDSATGKTTLIEMIREYYEEVISSGIDLICEKTCAVLAGRDWKALLNEMNERIIFIDEGNAFIYSTEFAKAVQQSDNYYVIATREGLPNLPYSIEEIYGIRESGKYASIKQTYNEFYHIYGDNVLSKKVVPETVENIKSEKILVIADGVAFGPEMDRMMKLLHTNKNVFLYLPESFEWLILKSEILSDREVREILEDPQDYIESERYFSWERFFAAVLIEKTKDSYLKYSKSRLNPIYLQKNIQDMICEQMKGIEFE